MVWYFHLFKNFPVCGDPHSQRLSSYLLEALRFMHKNWWPSEGVWLAPMNGY